MKSAAHATTNRSEGGSAAAAVTADGYAHWRATALGEVTERVETALVTSLAGPLEGKRVLDVGTGDGTYAIEAASAGAVVTGLDSDRDMLAAARARARRRGVRLALRRGRAESLPFAGGSFDTVIAVTVLCLVGEPRRAVAEMARVLAPGGRLVIGELARCSIWAAERRVRAWLGSDLWRQAHFWSRSELTGLVRAAGLEVSHVRGCVYFLPNGLAARLGEPFDRLLTRLRAPGAAFTAVAAHNPRK